MSQTSSSYCMKLTLQKPACSLNSFCLSKIVWSAKKFKWNSWAYLRVQFEVWTFEWSIQPISSVVGWSNLKFFRNFFTTELIWQAFFIFLKKIYYQTYWPYQHHGRCASFQGTNLSPFWLFGGLLGCVWGFRPGLHVGHQGHHFEWLKTCAQACSSRRWASNFIYKFKKCIHTLSLVSSRYSYIAQPDGQFVLQLETRELL